MNLTISMKKILIIMTSPHLSFIFSLHNIFISFVIEINSVNIISLNVSVPVT